MEWENNGDGCQIWTEVQGVTPQLIDRISSQISPPTDESRFGKGNGLNISTQCNRMKKKKKEIGEKCTKVKLTMKLLLSANLLPKSTGGDEK